MSDTTDDVPTTDAEAKVKAAIENVRPLSATQSKYLLKLVENDFNQLAAEIKEFSAEQTKAKIRELVEGASEQALKQFGDKGYKLLEKFRRDANDLVTQAKAQGISLKMPLFSTHSVETSDDELQNKINKVKADAQAEERSVFAVLRRKQLEAERKVMLATITSSTEDILQAIPDARSLMIEAAQQKAEREARAKELTSGSYKAGL